MQNQPDIGILEEFRIEFLDCWQRLPNKGFFFLLLVAWVAMFQFFGNSTLGFINSPSLLVWMYYAYQPSEMGDDGHGYLVPFVVLGLLWWKRKELLALQLREWWPALFLVGFGLFVHVLGFAVQQVRISIVGLFVGIYGLTGLAWGPSWLRRSFFPFCLFVFAVPLGTFAQSITFPLRLIVCRIVEGISHFLLSIDVVRDGTALKDPSGHYQYEVAAACSGLRSLIATVGFALVFGVVSFRTWWKRGVILASAIPLALAGNVLRMLLIIVSAEIGGQELGNKVHEGGPAGIFSLLPYIPAFVGIFALAHWLREPTQEKPARPTGLEARTA
jgi:exosortase